jgi:hypothetical protein
MPSLQDTLLAGLTQLYEVTVNYSDEHSDARSKRQMAAATAASVLGASLDRLNESDSDGFWASDWEDEEKAVRKRQSHFIDVLLSKLIERGLPHDIPDKSNLQDRIDDPIRKDMDSLSLSIFVKNLRRLTERLGGLFQFQYFLLRIFHWTNPSMTLLALMIYTLVVLHPNAMFILPLVFLLYGVMIPGYLYRHPIHGHQLHHLHERGDSLLNSFTRVKDDKQLEKFFEEELDRVPELETVDTKYVFMKKNMEFLVNLRDLQNNLTKMVTIFDKLEKFWYGIAGFKDERVSTSLFFTVCSIVVLLVVVGPYIPWRPLLIFNGWFVLIMIHPKMKPLVKNIKTLLKPQKRELDKVIKESERKDIIIDEEPEIRQVQIFEIWQRSHTTNEWEFYMFSNHIFHSEDPYRKSQAPPPGVSTIDDVSAPKSWRFDDDSWNVDYDCREWCLNSGIVLSAEEYVGDNNEFLVDEQFKRRRLYRDVIRYSRPARKPARLL